MPIPGLRDPFSSDPNRPTDPVNRPRILRDGVPERPVNSNFSSPPETGSEPMAISILPDERRRNRSRGGTQFEQRLGDLKERAKRFNDQARQRVGQHYREHIHKPATAAAQNLKQELAKDADYVKVRVRDYHENRPLQALGIVAAAGFLTGMAIGLGRRR